ncbi:helix-turn-helix domain-containing protein [Streptomyces canus]|uniref:helix-turn-helix domain-containing protein n=1 Tax=Streptomyces canus TaxID=58343 RepID=UPI00380566E9
MTETHSDTGTDGESALPRAVIQGAFGLLASLRRLGSARVSDLQRDCGLPRTTVHRLLGQLGEVGAVERSAGLWRLGPTLLELGTGVPAEPRLRMMARRPLMDLATSTGALVALSVEMAGQGLVIEVLPGVRRLAREPDPGMSFEEGTLAALGIEAANLAAVRAHRQAHRGDLRPVIDAGGNDPRVSCLAAPLRISPHDVAALWLMVPGPAGVPEPVVAATRRTAGRIATQLSRPGIG